MHYQCIGCGATIQTDDPHKPGYLPASALNKGIAQGEFYCQRCFRLRHYNELADIEMDESVFLERLSDIAHQRAYVIHMIDLFDIEGSFLTALPRFIGDQKYIIVANKFDLLPQATSLPRIRQRVTEAAHEVGLRPEEVYILSAKREETLKDLFTFIEQKVRHQDVYIVGVTNVGKSTFINQLIRHFGGERDIITTSNHHGTTLDLIEIPFNERYSVIDTPGIIRKHQIAYYLSRQSNQQIQPTKPLKPMTFQLDSGQTIFIAGLARIDFTKGERSAFTFYMDRDVYLHRTKTEKADDFYEKHVGDLLQPPTEEDLAKLPPLKATSLSLREDQDIAIAGLGWITVNRPVAVTLYVPREVQWSVRPKLI